jgi:hypothetical protein
MVTSLHPHVRRAVKKSFISCIELKGEVWVSDIDPSKKVRKIVRVDFFVKILLVTRRLNEHLCLGSAIKKKFRLR